MIAWLKGILLSKSPSLIVINVSGVGYLVEVPLSTYYELGAIETEVELHIQTQVREDAITLYGFSTTGEKSLFKKLISINGVGPKLALSIIGSMGPGDFLNAVDQGDFVRLTQIPGIGKKTAQRLVVELKDKLKELKSELDVSPELVGDLPNTTLQLDIVSALENLGYKQNIAEQAVRSALAENPDSSDFQSILRKALSLLTKK